MKLNIFEIIVCFISLVVFPLSNFMFDKDLVHPNNYYYIGLLGIIFIIFFLISFWLIAFRVILIIKDTKFFHKVMK